MTPRSKQQWIQRGILAAVVACVIGYFVVIRGWENASFSKQTELHTQQGMIPIYPVNHSSGATIAVVPAKELPMVDILLWFDAGSARDEAQWGIASLTARLLGEDTTQLNSQKIHDTFESVGAQFDAGVTRDTFAIHLRTLSDDNALKTSTKMLTTLLKETTFKPESVAREKARTIAAIESKADSARDTITDAFFMKTYGSHPYAHPVIGTAQTITTLTEQDLQAFYQQQIVQSRATIVIVGDISTHEGKKLAESLLETLPVGNPATLLPQPALPEAAIAHINFPSTQNHILFGVPALEKGNPDFFAMTVGNYMLGGSFTSLLFQAVREKEGLAYNVSSQLMTLRAPGPFFVYLQTRQEEANKALEITHNTLAEYMNSGPTDGALKAAKENINGTFLLSLSSNAEIAQHVATLGFYKLPWNYTDQFQSKINAVTREEVLTAFQKHVHPNHFTEVILGHAE